MACADQSLLEALRAQRLENIIVYLVTLLNSIFGTYQRLHMESYLRGITL